MASCYARQLYGVFSFGSFTADTMLLKQLMPGKEERRCLAKFFLSSRILMICLDESSLAIQHRFSDHYFIDGNIIFFHGFIFIIQFQGFF